MPPGCIETAPDAPIQVPQSGVRAVGRQIFPASSQNPACCVSTRVFVLTGSAALLDSVFLLGAATRVDGPAPTTEDAGHYRGFTLYSTDLTEGGVLTVGEVRDCAQFFLDGRPAGVLSRGRYWSRGPQKTLYLPGPLLRQGTNELAILELQGSTTRDVQFVPAPDLGPDEK